MVCKGRYSNNWIRSVNKLSLEDLCTTRCRESKTQCAFICSHRDCWGLIGTSVLTVSLYICTYHCNYRLKASNVNLKVELYMNGDQIDPANDRKLVTQLGIRDKTVSELIWIFMHCNAYSCIVMHLNWRCACRTYSTAVTGTWWYVTVV